MKLVATAEGKKLRNHQEEIFELLERELGKSRTIRKLARDIADRMALHRFRGIPEKEKVVPDLMRADIDDQEFIHQAVRFTLAHLVRGFDPSTPFRFNVLKNNKGGYIIDTNLNFETLNNVYHISIPKEHSTITVAFLLRHILDAPSVLVVTAKAAAPGVSVT